MNWPALLVQVEDMITSSQISLEEFRDIIGAEKWYEHPAWSTEQWWFGDKKRKSYMTFHQLHDFYREFMGLNPHAIMDALRQQLESLVVDQIRIRDEEAQFDLMREHDEAIEGAAA
jgi:ferredoxin-NADP reductase